MSAETTSAKKAAVTAPVPFSSEDNVQQVSAPALAQVSAPVAAAAPAQQFSNSDRMLEDAGYSNSNETPSGMLITYSLCFKVNDDS